MSSIGTFRNNFILRETVRNGIYSCVISIKQKTKTMKYYVNKNSQSNGDHEVHDEYCPKLPNLENRIYLGEFSSCHPAVAAAKNYYSKADGCKICSDECHNS